jgi:murein DD-endopeptidase MepM/ murein hydrolase activator NlpD
LLKQQLFSSDKIRVGDVLIQKGLITPADLTQALLEQRNTQTKLGEILVQQGLLTHQQLQAALNEQRWRNWTAAILLTLGTLVAGVPKLATALPIKIDKTSTVSGQNSSSEIFSEHVESNSQPHNSLSANPDPTIASPLQGFCHPLNGLGYLSEGNNGPTHRGRMTYAYDLATHIGTPVYAMRGGQVMAVQDKYPDTGGGQDKIARFNYAMIEHDGGYRSVYVHLQQKFVSLTQIKVGDRIDKGQLIGYSGNSGWSSGPHLHIEIQRPGSKLTFTQTIPFAIAGVCEPGAVTMARHWRASQKKHTILIH